MGNIADYWQGFPPIIAGVGAVLVLLSGLFITVFLFRALRTLFRLRRVLVNLEAVQGRKDQALEAVFSDNGTLAHLWREYKDTLHRQQEHDADGKAKPVVLRSTVPAAFVFTNEVIVDTPLKTEFFKHLPGIFTGVGIIGTFWGLIHGLQGFQVSDDPLVARASLEQLMHHVSSAFVVSAMAILMAMVATFIEKSLVAVLYAKVEGITARLDSFFHSGAGEEYLARLTRASEETSVQSQLLKDALVTDLERILTRITEDQMTAHRTGLEALGNHLADSMERNLQKPLEILASGVNRTAQGNTQAVTELLTDVLAGFSDKLQHLFGGQITGINELQQKTINALESAAEKMNVMVRMFDEAGNKTSEAMNERLVTALSSMEAHQNSLNARMAEFVEQLRKVANDSQAETQAKLQETLAELGESVREQLAALKAQGDKANAGHDERQNRATAATEESIRRLGASMEEILGALNERANKSEEKQADREKKLTDITAATVEKLSGVAETLMKEVHGVASEVRVAVEAMRSVTSDAVTKMSGGAETLMRAASEFASAGQAVTGTIREVTALTGGLRQSASEISGASQALKSVVADHASARATFAKMLDDLNRAVENAKKEAGLTADVLQRIERSAQSLGQAQLDAEEYLSGVSQVLGESHQKFAASLSSVLGDANKQFYERLSAATGLLRQAIEELSMATEPVRRDKSGAKVS